MNVQNDNVAIAEVWFHAFNTKDLTLLLSLYTDEAVHYSPKLKVRLPETEGLIKGKAALHAWWDDAFARLPTLQYLPTAFTANNERVLMEYVRKVAGEQDMLVAEVLEIRNGVIVASRVYHG